MNLALHNYITQLLFDHECVVVPGFGAFLTRCYPAEINQATHMMRPPSRRVHFNKSIKQNDGLLAKTISLLDHRPYDMALADVHKEVEQWKQTLLSGSKLRLPGIGRLYLDDSRNLQFSPSIENNYLPSSFGLAIFRSPAIEREEAIRKSIHKTIERHIVAEPKTAVATTRKSRRIPWAAILGPVIFAGVVGAAYFTWRPNDFQNISGLNWPDFSHGTEQTITEEPLTEEKPETTEIALSDAETTNVAPVESMAEVRSPAEEALAAESEAGAISSGYHLVVGSFKDEVNAQVLIDKLHDKGFTAYLAQGDKRFHRVAVSTFDSREAAETALQSVRQSINSGAWVYAN